jgi:hypothetical protein
VPFYQRAKPFLQNFEIFLEQLIEEKSIFFFFDSNNSFNITILYHHRTEKLWLTARLTSALFLNRHMMWKISIGVVLAY